MERFKKRRRSGSLDQQLLVIKWASMLLLGRFSNDPNGALLTAGTAVTGGVLYTVGTAIAVSGQYAPISLLLVCGVVFIFRFIFAELSSIPFDGGVYSLMLVGSTKLVAAIAACCSILDLAATAVVSAGTASNYFYGHWGLINTYGATIGILAAFAILALFGVKDSANLSLAIFVVHILTMCALVGASIVFWIRNGPDILVANWNLPSPSGNVAKDIFSGFCVGMLGFTGFETVCTFTFYRKATV